MSDPINPYQAPIETSSLPITTQGSYEELAGTATGLRIIYFGILLVLLCMIVSTVAIPLFPRALAGLGAMILVGFLMWAIGPFFCLTAPAETRTKGLVLGNIVCQVVSLVVYGVSMSGVIFFRYSSVLTNLLSVVGLVLFVLAMMRIAKYIHRDDLHASGRAILVGGGIVLVLGLLTGLGILVIGAKGAILMLGVLVGLLIVFVLYANFVNSLARAIQSLRR